MKLSQLRLLIKEIVTQLISEEVILGNVNIDLDTLKRLKKAYNKAVKENKTSFIFNGKEILTELAKFAIEHMSYRLRLKEILDPNITINRACPMCGDVNSITVDRKALDRWKSGVKIQDAFPNLTDEQRELLKTGICNSCWDKLFGDT